MCGGIQCIRDTSVENRNKSYAEKAGLKKIRIHDFRHSHASYLANNGINIQEIARRLGHSKVDITWNTYSHLYPKEEDRAVAVLENIEKTN
ncbi:MAG: tyrosine-type recombinase/integrase [Clostridia bacterium]